LALTSPTSDGRSVGIVHSHNKATVIIIIIIIIIINNVKTQIIISAYIAKFDSRMTLPLTVLIQIEMMAGRSNVLKSATGKTGTIRSLFVKTTET
jgi:hypothetical protein